MNISQAGPVASFNAEIDIWPGDTVSQYPVLQLLANSIDYGTQFLTITGFFTLNPAATHAPTFARANMIQFQSYGNEDFPPTSGQTLTAGSYILWGITA